MTATFTEEAYEVLKQASHPMTSEEIIDAVLAGRRFSTQAKNVHASLGGTLDSLVRGRCGERWRGRFVKVGPRTYGLAEWKKEKPQILKVKTAEEATEVALSFLTKHYRFIPQQPIKAVREDNLWLVEIDVGLLRTRIAKLKIDAKTATILEYAIPSEAV